MRGESGCMALSGLEVYILAFVQEVFTKSSKFAGEKYFGKV